MPSKNCSKPLKTLTGVVVGFGLLTIVAFILTIVFPAVETVMMRILLGLAILLAVSGVALVIFAMAVSKLGERAAEEIYRKPLAPARIEQAAQLIPEMVCELGFERVGLIGFDPEHRMELYVRHRTFSKEFLAFLSAESVSDALYETVSRELLHMLPHGDPQEQTRVLVIANVRHGSVELKKFLAYGILPRFNGLVSYVGAVVAEEATAYWSSLNLYASYTYYRRLQKYFLRCIKLMTVRK